MSSVWHPCAYQASIFSTALKSLLQRLGLVVKTVNDAAPSDSSPQSSLPLDTTGAHPVFADANAAGFPSPSSRPSALQHLVGHNIERVLHDAADYSDSKAIQVMAVRTQIYAMEGHQVLSCAGCHVLQRQQILIDSDDMHDPVGAAASHSDFGAAGSIAHQLR